jgi:hypothetical protein
LPLFEASVAVSQFYLAVKSTIDKVAHDLATQLSVEAVEIDDVTNVEEKLASPDDLIMFQLVDMQPEPSDPLYSLQFEVGVKTTKDSANYDLATLLSSVQDEIAVEDVIFVQDYSELTPPTDDLGYIYITGSQIDPQAFEGLSGVRMQTVYAKAVRYV